MVSVWLLIDILCARTTDQELLKLKRCVPVLRPPLLFRCGVQGRMWLRLYKLSQAPVVIILYIKKKRETERARARQRWYDQRRRVPRWWGRPSGWVHACVKESLSQTWRRLHADTTQGSCVFFGLEFFRLARDLKALTSLRVAWSYKRVAPSDLVYERGHGKQEVRARAAAQQMQGLWRYTYTLCFNSAAS